MPDDVPQPGELGFAEFVTTLIAETFASIVAAQTDQEQRHAELLAAAEADVETFARTSVDDPSVDAALAQLFPDPEHGHAARIDAPYRPGDPDAGTSEEPPFEERLGVTLDRDDYVVSENSRLKPSGVEKIRAAAALRIAAQQQIVLRETMRRGVPRVLVDSGHVTAKLTFSISPPQAAAAPATPEPTTVSRARNLLVPLEPLSRIGFIRPERLEEIGHLRPEVLDKVRLVVRQADERAPETGRLRADVFGEVEVTFKTVL
jgi:hypothetical protein